VAVKFFSGLSQAPAEYREELPQQQRHARAQQQGGSGS